MDKDRIHVTLFSSGERTKDLAIYAIKSLGFNNLNVIHDTSTSFAEKMTEFVNQTYNVRENFDFFIRTDADEIIFNSIFIHPSCCSKLIIIKISQCTF